MRTNCRALPANFTAGPAEGEHREGEGRDCTKACWGTSYINFLICRIVYYNKYTGTVVLEPQSHPEARSMGLSDQVSLHVTPSFVCSVSVFSHGCQLTLLLPPCHRSHQYPPAPLLSLCLILYSKGLLYRERMSRRCGEFHNQSHQGSPAHHSKLFPSSGSQLSGATSTMQKVVRLFSPPPMLPLGALKGR